MAQIILRFPFTGWWMARNSPARRVPSHGTWWAGTGYAIDFIGLDDEGKRAPWGFASTFGTEPNEKFPGFGRDVIAPCSGTVVLTYDGLPDHLARRSQFHLVHYMLGQKKRFDEGGAHEITGNMVMIETETREYVSMMHLQHKSVVVREGQRVEEGELLGKCGNSGNSTQPHVHMQVTDRAELIDSVAIEMAFLNQQGEPWMPGENEKFFVE